MMYMSPCGLMEYRVQVVEFKKHIKDVENIRHKARIVTYVDLTKKKPKVIYYKNYRGEKLRRLIIFIKKSAAHSGKLMQLTLYQLWAARISPHKSHSSVMR